MRVAIPSTGPNLDDMVEARIELCACFIIFDFVTMEFEAIPNPNSIKRIDNGILAVQSLVEKDVAVVLTGYCNTSTFKVFNEVNIQVITGVTGPVRNVIQHYNRGFFKNFMNIDTDNISA